MTIRPTLSRIIAAVALLGSLGACTVVPAPPGYYRSTPVVVESYPTYRHAPGYGYSNDDRRSYYGNGDGGRGYYREERHYREPARIPSPLEVHREIRRSLGLPRLPGMP